MRLIFFQEFPYSKCVLFSGRVLFLGGVYWPLGKSGNNSLTKFRVRVVGYKFANFPVFATIVANTGEMADLDEISNHPNLL